MGYRTVYFGKKESPAEFLKLCTDARWRPVGCYEMCRAWIEAELINKGRNTESFNGKSYYAYPTTAMYESAKNDVLPSKKNNWWVRSPDFEGAKEGNKVWRFGAAFDKSGAYKETTEKK